MHTLFDSSKEINLLPFDGEAYYYGPIFSLSESKNIYSQLVNEIDWKSDVLMMFGKKITTSRKVAWYGDNEYSYTYSQSTKKAIQWTELLLELKKHVQDLTGATYNSCLLNLYHDGKEGMTWHSDNESMLCEQASIASLSFGAPRKFKFKHRLEKFSVELTLENAGLLDMLGATQVNWLHSLPKSKTVHSPRINLTFRKVKKI